MSELSTEAKSVLQRAKDAVDKAKQSAVDARLAAETAERLVQDADAAQQHALTEENVRVVFDAADALDATDAKLAERLRQVARDMDDAGAIVGAP
jgi:hypothetical protein